MSDNDLYDKIGKWISLAIVGTVIAVVTIFSVVIWAGIELVLWIVHH